MGNKTGQINERRTGVTNKLRREIAAGIREVERGETIDGPTYMREWKESERRVKRRAKRFRAE